MLLVYNKCLLTSGICHGFTGTSTLISKALHTFISIMVLVKIVHLSCMYSCKQLSGTNFFFFLTASRESQSGSSKQKKKAKSQQYKGHKKSGSPYGVYIHFLNC